MPLFVTSKSNATGHGVYAIAQTPPLSLTPSGTGIVGYAGQFPWGPMQEVQQPADIGTALNMYAPRGMTRTGSAYLGLIGSSFPDGFKLLRIHGVGAVKASANLPNVVPTDIVAVTLKYEGTEGNSCTWTVSAASDGDANHFDITVTVTGASGTTTDTIRNINVSGVGADDLPAATDYDQLRLVGAVAKLVAGRPINGTGSFAGGTNPAIVSGDYVGTQGSGDKGLSLFEGETDVRHICTDDPGNTIRAAVNAGLKAHAEYMGDRVAYLNGNSTLTSAATIADVANYRSGYCIFADPWYYKRDDVDGTERLVPPGILAAKVAAQTSPSTSMAWKAAEQTAKLGEIVRLQYNRGNAKAAQTTAGICTIIREKSGAYAFEAGVLTVAPQSPSTKNLTRIRMGIYIADAFINGVQGMVDAPNVPKNQDAILIALNTLLSNLLAEKNRDPNHAPYINGYTIAPTAASNTAAEIQAGDFNVACDVQIGSSMERIFLLLNFGETVTVTIQ